MLEKFYKLKNQIKSKIIFDHDIGNMTWFKAGGKAKIFILVDQMTRTKLNYYYKTKLVLNSKLNKINK